MSLEYQLLIAVGLDLLFGDPRWLPHPVRLIGRLALGLERPCRRLIPAPRPAGVVAVLLVIAITGITVYGLMQGAAFINTDLRTIISILLLYTTIAVRDLIIHSLDVYKALTQDDLVLARQKVGFIVGRDTTTLDAEGVTRAAIESVAESLVDGVTAPLFFACLGGPIGAMVYKAINTLDSTFGYKNERYLEFGWAAARLDDLANFVPARLTGLLLPLVAFFSGLDWRRSIRIFRRDRLQHASPNSGHTEAAVAGALGIRLGGPNYYFGKLVDKPLIGDAENPIAPQHIKQTNKLLVLTATLFLGIFVLLRLAFF